MSYQPTNCVLKFRITVGDYVGVFGNAENGFRVFFYRAGKGRIREEREDVFEDAYALAQEWLRLLEEQHKGRANDGNDVSDGGSGG